MNEYLVFYVAEDGKHCKEIYAATSLTHFKAEVKAKAEEGYSFQIYQLVPVQTDWVEQWDEEKQNV